MEFWGGMRGRNPKTIHSSAFFRRYVDTVKTTGVKYDVVIINGPCRELVGRKISFESENELS